MTLQSQSEMTVLGQYSFLPEASAWLAEGGPTFEELTEAMSWASIRAEGAHRALQSIEEFELRPPDGSLRDTLAGIYARILIRATADSYCIRRYATAESKVLTKLLSEDLKHLDIAERVTRALGLHTTFRPPDFMGLHFTQYLPVAGTFKDQSWKLLNKGLKDGFVELSYKQMVRLAEDAYRKHLESSLSEMVDYDLSPNLKRDIGPLLAAAAEKKARFATPEGGPVEFVSFPPCMTRILAMLQTGENAPHAARFAITSYLHTLGLSADEIVSLFAKAPDFREDLTRYQVEHITGKSSGTSYTPPGCQAMKTYGICYGEDDWCRRTNASGERYVTHPLGYYRWAEKRRMRDAPAPKTADVPPS